MNCINVTTLKPNKQTKEWKASQKYSLGRSQELSNVDKQVKRISTSLVFDKFRIDRLNEEEVALSRSLYLG